MPLITEAQEIIFRNKDPRLLINELMDSKYHYDNMNECWIYPHDPKIEGYVRKEDHCLKPIKTMFVRTKQHVERLYAYSESIEGNKYYYSRAEAGKLAFSIMEKKEGDQWRLISYAVHDGPFGNCCISDVELKKINQRGEQAFVFALNGVWSGYIMSDYIFIALNQENELVEIANINRISLADQEYDAQIELLRMKYQEDLFFPIQVIKTDDYGKIINTKTWRFNAQKYVYEEYLGQPVIEKNNPSTKITIK